MRTLGSFVVLLSLALPFSASAAPKASAKKPVLKFDGMYQQYPPVIDSSDEEHRWYLRFYEDGTVIQKETIVAPETWGSKFTRENDKVWKGTWKVTGDHLTIAIEHGTDRVTTAYHVDGVILSGDKLKVTLQTSFSIGAGEPAIHTDEWTFAYLPETAPPKK